MIHKDISAERAVLGAILADNENLDRVCGILCVDDFASTAHATIWVAMLAVRSSRRRVDHLALAEELQARGDLARVGGPPYLMGLDMQVPFARNATQYAQVVADRAERRRAAEPPDGATSSLWEFARVFALSMLDYARRRDD